MPPASRDVTLRPWMPPLSPPPPGAVTSSKFAELPAVGGWGRRPLELATLRLQTMIGVSLGNWKARWLGLGLGLGLGLADHDWRQPGQLEGALRCIGLRCIGLRWWLRRRLHMSLGSGKAVCM